SSIFIFAKNGPYAFDLVPGFWTLLDERAAQGVIRSSTMVYDEIVNEADDELADWFKARKDSGFFVVPDTEVQAAFTDVANHVHQSFDRVQAAEFLNGADPWIIAHAKAHSGKVATCEVLVPPTSRKVKIPNVCMKFGLGYLNLYDLLRALGASFSV